MIYVLKVIGTTLLVLVVLLVVVAGCSTALAS